MYAIRGLLHRTDLTLGAHGFSIDLAPKFKVAVAASGITQERIDAQIRNCGRSWLDGAGFNRRMEDGSPLYSVHHIRVKWGEWGPEHISVPGNACGLDIERSSFSVLFKDGVSLHPHNVDSLTQKYLLLVVFGDIAESILLFARTF